MRITWIGHSTVVFELDGVRLITDPVLRQRIGFLRRIGRADTGALDGLGALLISHAHYDHLDVPSLARFDRRLPCVVPVGAGKILRRRGFRDVVELRPDERISIGPLTILATHAEHAPGRHPLGPPVPALGYCISGSYRAYFAGDTDLFETMDSISPLLDVAVLPVSGWGPRIPAGHLDPLRAAQALRLLRPRVAVPIHWGTYRRVGSRFDAGSVRAPADAFARHAAELAPDVDVRTLSPGETTELDDSIEVRRTSIFRPTEARQ